MTKTTESVLFLFSPPMQACYSLSSAPTSPALFSFVKTSASVGSTGASFTTGLL